MPTRVKVKWNGDQWLKKFNAGCERNMNDAAIYLQGKMIDKLNVPGPAPSAPGEAPHKQIGTLRRSVGWEKVSAFVRKVGSAISGYPLYLEFGTGKYYQGKKKKKKKVAEHGIKPRPWLRPSLYENTKDLIRIMFTPIKT